MNKPNEKGIRRYNGVGFVRIADGHYRTSHQWRFWDTKRVRGGWECNGTTFRTMADVADYIATQV